MIFRSNKKSSSKSIGLPPGSLVYVGTKKSDQVKIKVIDYDETGIEEKEFLTVEDDLLFKEKKNIRWIHLIGLHQLDIIEKLGKQYQIHDLILEDVLNTSQRPKMEDYEDILFVVLKILYNDSGEVDNNQGKIRDISSEEKKDKRISVEQLGLVLGENFVISFQEGEKDILAPVRKRIKNSQSRFRKMGSDYLVYALIDTVVDHYFMIMETLDNRIEAIEKKLFTDLSNEALQEIHQLKHDILFLRKVILPVRTLIDNLDKVESPFIHDETRIFIRDLYDHVMRVIDTLEIFREVTMGLLDIYHTMVSNKMNEIMEVLTLIATIFIPLTFIAGIYGMNFKYMPELEWRWGYLFVWILIILVAAVMLFYFKKKKWL